MAETTTTELEGVVKMPTVPIGTPGGNLPITMADVAISPVEELVDDDICIAIREDDTPDSVLKSVLLGLAEEQSSLKTLRVKKSNDGKDTSFISLKRGTLLKYMSETL